jgi:succinyl-diaminopimelate desuccinylase
VSVTAFLQEILRLESRSGDESRLAARVVLEMQNSGFDAAWIDETGNALGLVSGRNRGAGVMLLTHLDHIDVGDLNLWQHPPFAGVLEAGVLHGRGATDIKGPLAAQICTLKAMLKAGGAGMAALMQQLPIPTPLGDFAPGACVVGEPSSNRVMLGHRGVCRSTITFHGRAHHASLGLVSDNPHFALAKFLTRLETFQPVTHEILGGSSLTPTVIHADTSSNNLTPNRIDLTLDWRTTLETPQDVRRTFETLLDGLPATFTSFEDWHGSEKGIKHPGFVTGRDHPLVTQLQRAVTRAIPNTLEPGIWRFATDGRFSHAQGIATVGFGPGDERLAHTTRECIAVSELEAHIQALTAFLTDYAPAE